MACPILVSRAAAVPTARRHRGTVQARAHASATEAHTLKGMSSTSCVDDAPPGSALDNAGRIWKGSRLWAVPLSDYPALLGAARHIIAESSPMSGWLEDTVPRKWCGLGCLCAHAADRATRSQAPRPALCERQGRDGAQSVIRSVVMVGAVLWFICSSVPRLGLAGTTACPARPSVMLALHHGMACYAIACPGPCAVDDTPVLRCDKGRHL
jgi:hypothetical protein